MNIFKKHTPEIIFVFFSLIFSFWLMFSTFSYENGSMLVASKAWSDFASHIPLIRSFSFGANFPPEYPLFSGEPIRYHFLFYLLVGLIEKVLPINWALNLPSSLSFFFLLIMIYSLSLLIFKKRFVAIVSVFLFVFNGSLSFVYFFQKNPLSFPKSLFDIIDNNIFPAFAPYDNTFISGGFWNLNVFTNQRHFALPLAVIIFIIYLLTKNEIEKKSLGIKVALIFGIIIGSFSFLHGAVFIMSIALLSFLFVLFPFQRKSIIIIGFVAFITSFPRMLFLFHVESNQLFKFNPGYLLVNDFSLFKWGRYWLLNLGLGALLGPIGFIFAAKIAKKIFIAFLVLFAVGNLFQFSPDIATNHKFFNLWLIIFNMFTAYSLYLIWKGNLFKKSVVFILLFFLTFSGIIDFFPIKNDLLYRIDDFPKNSDIKWIIDNTPKNSVFLNTSYLYNPANIAGRKIFLGWPYFSWSLGYNTYQRDETRKKLFNSTEVKKFCNQTKNYGINYVMVEPVQDLDFSVNKEFFENYFKKSYHNSQTGFSIYNVEQTCQNNSLKI